MGKGGKQVRVRPQVSRRVRLGRPSLSLSFSPDSKGPQFADYSR